MAVKFKYEEHHWKYLDECNKKNMTYNAMHKAWPFTDILPSVDSVRKRLRSVQAYGAEVCIRGDHLRQPRTEWTEEADNDLLLAYKICGGNIVDIAELYKECEITTTHSAIDNRLERLRAKGKLETNYMAQFHQDWTEVANKQGFEIIGESTVAAKGTLNLRCLAFGHETTKEAWAVKETGCSYCSAAGSLSLGALKNSKFGKLPCNLYVIEFDDGVVKVGISKYDVSHRGKGWPNFFTLRQFPLNTFEARRIESLAHNKITRIPYYHPIAHNGATECFNPWDKEEVLTFVDHEVNHISEDAKNNT